MTTETAAADTVTLPTLYVAQLAEYALDHLHAADQDQGCCPACCAACHGLWELDSLGHLNVLAAECADYYRWSATGCVWWDAATRTVDEGLLYRAWRRTDCHAAAPTADAEA